MSVIFGKYHIDKKPLPKSDLEKMQNRLNHWNADDTGIWKNEYVGLGHLMLWNTPESLHEKLPYTSPYSGNVITADARIDNREELFAKLKIADHSVPDSLLILATYDKYGKNCVHHLIGDFAFVIWDKHKEVLFCGRDPMGARAFHYYFDKKIFAFASNIGGLLALSEIKKNINKEYFIDYFHYIGQPELGTAYDNIFPLRPAHSLVVQQNAPYITTKRYWDLNPKIEYDRPFEENREKLLDLFQEAVRCRMRTIYPIGSQLSGGLDSSGITGVASHFIKKANNNENDLHTFSYILAPNTKIGEDERNDIDKNIDFFDLKNPHRLYTKANTILDIVRRDIGILNNALPRSTSIMCYDLEEPLVKNNIRTVLSGYMGDIIVTSRGKRNVQEAIAAGNYLYAFKYLKKSNQDRNLYHFIRRILAYYYHAYVKPDIEVDSGFIPLKPEFINEHRVKNYHKENRAGYSFKEFQYQQFHHPLTTIRYTNENTILQEFKAEMRFPMADTRLLAFSLGLPSEQKNYFGKDRYAFRQAVKGYIPEDTRRAKKLSSFTYPMGYPLYLKSAEYLLDYVKKYQNEGWLYFIDMKRIIMHLESFIHSKSNKDFVKVRRLIMVLMYYIEFVEKENDKIDLFD